MVSARRQAPIAVDHVHSVACSSAHSSGRQGGLEAAPCDCSPAKLGARATWRPRRRRLRWGVGFVRCATRGRTGRTWRWGAGTGGSLMVVPATVPATW